MSFQHTALARAATSDDLVLLSQAAGTIGSPDPIVALRHMDCDPPAVVALADQVEHSAARLRDASGEYRAGVGEISGGWSGEAHDAFAASAAELGSRYADTLEKTEQTAKAGRDVAANLDSLATGTAADAMSIAASVGEQCRQVLSGEREPQAVEAVNEACREIVKRVQSSVASVGELAATLSAIG